MLPVFLGTAIAQISFAAADSTFQTVIVNDFDDAHVHSSGAVPWSEGTYSQCHDSHDPSNSAQLDFHHDSAANKGSVAATYEPELRMPGCWEIFEWHPGSSQACSQYLPRSAPVVIRESCGSGQVRLVTVHIDQSVNGQAWNSIGRFQFDSGRQSIVFSNDGTTDCLSLACYWVRPAQRPHRRQITFSCLTSHLGHCTFAM